MKTRMIIYCNAVLSPFLRKNQSNHVTWMSSSLSLETKKKVKSITSRERDTVSRALSASVIRDGVKLYIFFLLWTPLCVFRASNWQWSTLLTHCGWWVLNNEGLLNNRWFVVSTISIKFWLKGNVHVIQNNTCCLSKREERGFRELVINWNWENHDAFGSDPCLPQAPSGSSDRNSISIYLSVCLWLSVCRSFVPFLSSYLSVIQFCLSLCLSVSESVIVSIHTYIIYGSTVL